MSPAAAVRDMPRASPRPHTGLFLLVVAIAASILAYALQGLGLTEELPGDLAGYAIAFAAAAVAGWLAVRRSARIC